ncbi:bifunctional demethylmenaquinone methyltransferase/2-methoxy-6-polyprenyl-1,4-benzoquinol methylase UbiE [bacterium]|nr:bifunctional demethylmenaquinone methyltransferase/2-methoxy-6-polyprenyl-1,4-benzoquinol methylase UbiE [bacterium]
MKNPDTIRNMFSTIAPKYDRANSILSFGIHKFWRKELVSWIQSSQKERLLQDSPIKVLDCATGTGDVAIEIKKALKDKADVVGVDFCEPMLKVAPGKAKRQNLDIHFQVADVMKLPFEDNTFDVVTISFGIRNVASAEEGIKEMTRVLKPRGELYILEFGQPESNFFSNAYNFYSQKVLPRVGAMVTGNKTAYEYLEDSSSQFPCKNHFLKMMQDSAPLYKVKFKALTMGVAYLYRGIKSDPTKPQATQAP